MAHMVIIKAIMGNIRLTMTPMAKRQKTIPQITIFFKDRGEARKAGQGVEEEGTTTRNSTPDDMPDRAIKTKNI